ncbi:MAG: tetratricopeptide repeat protein [Lentisphaeria bacterium]|nr:tetratricopeptide repeat protein [Lentisphaeria bacterium]
MKKFAAYKLLCATVVLFSGLALHAIADAFMFAGNSDTCNRYLRLGELALENDAPATAADFFRQAYESALKPQLRAEAADLWLESLLTTHKRAEADKLMTQWSKEFANSDMLKLMQGRILLHDNKFDEAAGIFRALSARLTPGDKQCYKALELLGKALSRAGKYAEAQKSYADLAAIAGKDALWQFKALEGLIFLSLSGDDLARAKQTYELLQKDVPSETRKEFKSRIEKLAWLIDCHDGKSAALEAQLLKRMEKAVPPDPLLARIAYTIAGEASDDAARQVKFARLACRFAEGAFKRTAQQALIQLEIAGQMWQQALDDALDYRKRFAVSAAARSEIESIIGDIYIHLGKTDEAVKVLLDIYNNAEAPIADRLDAARILARLYQQKARVQEASAMFEFAINHAADEALKNALHHEFGEYLYQLGRYSEAAKHFQNGARAGNNMAKSQIFLAQSLYMLKDFKAAAAQLQPALQSQDAQLQQKAAYLDALLAEELLTADEAVAKFSAFTQKYPDSAESEDALFRAAKLAQKSSKLDSVKLLKEYAARYPGEKAANALYNALHIRLGQDDQTDAEALLKELAGKYPDSKFTIGGMFSMVDHQRNNKQWDQAIRQLEQLEQRYKTSHPELLPELLYDRATIYDAIGDNGKKLSALEELLNKYPDHAIAHRAFFMLGDMRLNSGDYAGALAAFQQAGERSRGIFSYGCAGKAADAAYSLYIGNRKEEFLRQAQEGYENLLKAKDLPVDFAYQSMYKLGRCLEEANDSAGALRQYRQIIYQAVLATREKRSYPQLWCIKALDSALKMLTVAIREAPSADQAGELKNEARRLLKITRQLELPGENIDQQLEALNAIRPQSRNQ